MKLWKRIAGAPGSAAFAGELRDALDAMERELGSIAGESGPLRGGLERVMGSGGKRLRPLLAWTCWRLSGRRMEIVPLMAMLELMHTASLIHDDFVDGAAARRGAATISASDGGLTALRSGDYLLSRAMGYLKIYRGSGINEALSALSQEMCLGELIQRAGLFRARGMAREDYFLCIRRKTALFLAESCRCGAAAGGADTAAAEILREYGLHLGMAFQMRDDLLDFDAGAGTGKPAMQDLRSGVITLPVLLALERGGVSLSAVERREKTPGEMREILAGVRSSGALEETRAILARECAAAASALSALPESAETGALALLANMLSEVKPFG